MPPLVNVIAGIVCLGLSVNFFRLAMAPESVSETIEVKPGSSKCTPSGDLLKLSKDELRAKCGEPRSVNHQMLGGGQLRKEQWSYINPVFYVYLSNDKVETIQYADNGQNFEWKN